MLNEEKFITSLLFSKRIPNSKKISSLNEEVVVKIASKHLILPLLYYKLKTKNLLNRFQKDFTNYLKEIYQINKNRNEILLDEINDLSNLLNKSNLPHVFLKGAAHLKSNIYDDIGVRMVGDIDILAPEEESKKIYEILKTRGYNNLPEYIFFESYSKHFPRQFNKKKVFAVEIHRRLLENEDKVKIDINSFIENKTSLNSVNVPSYNDQLLHNIYNYQINDYGNDTLSYNYRNIYDSYKLLERKKLKFEENEVLKNYFQVCRHLNLNFFSQEFEVNYVSEIRLMLKKKSKRYDLIDNLVFIELSKLKYKPRQFLEIIKNKDYRKYLIKKLKNKFNSDINSKSR